VISLLSSSVLILNDLSPVQYAQHYPLHSLTATHCAMFVSICHLRQSFYYISGRYIRVAKVCGVVPFSEQESPAVADKPAQHKSMPKIAPIRRAYNVVAGNTCLFIHLDVVASKICKIQRNSLKIQVQGHPRSSILVSIESAYATSL